MFLATLAALAQSSDPGGQVGKNIGDILQGFARPVYIGVVCVFALAFLMGRKIAGLAIYLVVAVIVGVVIFNPGGFTDLVKSIGDAVSNGV